ncbi:MAG: hypothetical protein WCO25_04070 [Candidatus Uhrbacteria bacterium]
MIKGTLHPATFAALADTDKMKAYVGGSAAALPSDFEGESIEESVKYAFEHAGLNGSEFLRTMFARMPIAKLGIKIAGAGVSNVLIDALIGHANINPTAKMWINLIGRNVMQGIISGYVDASDPEKGRRALDQAIHDVNTTQYVNKVEAVVPGKAMVVLMTDPGTGIKMIHAAAIDGAAYADIPDSGAPAVPATTCQHCEQAYALHAASFRKETSTTGGKDGKGGSTKVTNPPTYRNAKRMLLTDAEALSGIFYCPETWPAGKPAPAKAPGPAKTWMEKVGREGIELFDAVLLYPKTTPSMVDDIKGEDIATEATNVPVDEWIKLAKDIQAGTGLYAGCWISAPVGPVPTPPVPTPATVPPIGTMGRFAAWIGSFFGAPTAPKPAEAPVTGLTKKGFDLVLSKIVSRGSGKLKAENVVKVAAFNAWETFWREENLKVALKGLAVAAGALVGYVTWAGVTLYYYQAALFAEPDADAGFTAADINEHVLSLFYWSISVLLWFVVWYFAGALRWATAGLLKSELPATAKATTVLFCGTASVAISFLLVDSWSKGIAFMPALPLTVFVLTAIVGDRFHSMWHEDETIVHRWKRISLGKLNAVNALGTAAIVGMLILIVIPWIVPEATFRVSVESRIVDGGEPTFYVPTPKGGAFPVSVLGRTKADAITAEMIHVTRSTDPKVPDTATVDATKPVCLPKGSSLDLPGYAEVEVADSKCPAGEVGWAVRERLFGRFLDGGAKEYGSLRELVADEQEADIELAEQLKAATPETDRLAAEAQARAEAEAKAKADAEALAKAQAEATASVVETTGGQADAGPGRMVVSDADRCARLAGYSPSLRASQGCE